MLIEFTLTLDDYRKMRLALKDDTAKVEAKKIRSQRGFLTTTAVTVVMVFVVEFIQPYAPPGTHLLAHLVATYFTLTLFRTLILIINAIRRGEAKYWKVVLPWLGNLALMAIPLYFEYTIFAPNLWEYSAPQIFWLCFLLYPTFSDSRNESKTLEKAWEAIPSAHRPRQVEITAEGISSTDGPNRTTSHWSAFIGFVETPDIFILRTGPNSGSILPKRAFHSEEEMDALRALSRAITENSPIGFPVAILPAGRIAINQFSSQ